MILIADISVPADVFPLGRVLQGFPEVEIELERLVPLREAIIPLFWIEGVDIESADDKIRETLRTDATTEAVNRLTKAGDRVLYEVHWSPEVNGLIDAITNTDAEVLQAEGTADVWDFRLQFRSRDALVAFRSECENKDIPVTLRRLYNPTVPEENGRLTDNQFEALVTAYEQGYFEVPRDVSMTELATQFDISDSAFSQRLRRGTSALIAETLVGVQ